MNRVNLFPPKSAIARCKWCRLFVGSKEVPYKTRYPCFCCLCGFIPHSRDSKRSEVQLFDRFSDHHGSIGVSPFAAGALGGLIQHRGDREES